MIGQEEIKSQAIILDIHHANVERDYVFGWLLKSIYENDYLRARLIFKGGNCLRKAFYPDTRFSADLDFSVLDAIDVETMARHINIACSEAQAICGVEFLIDRNTFDTGPIIDKNRRSYKGKIYFTDFFGNQENLTISIKLDLTEFDKLLIPSIRRKLIHPYSDSEKCSVDLNCMALEEIVANKLKCLIQRRHSHDLFDLVYSTFIDKTIELDRGLVLRTFLRKTIFEASPGAAKNILLGVPMAFFGNVWEKYIKCPKTTRFGFDRALEGFKDSIERLFDGVRTGSWGEQLYFTAEHRNLIMEAGGARKLMKLTYHGVERIIEPYALAYKQPSGKAAREYFYAYDRTGGKTSGPSIKSFINTEVETLSILEETFDPQYEIEVSKAGEEARQAHFGKPFGQGAHVHARKLTRGISAIPRKAPAFKGFQPSHKVQCPYCQKIFTRKTLSLALNEHKAPDGYRCNGRSGYRVY